MATYGSILNQLQRIVLAAEGLEGEDREKNISFSFSRRAEQTRIFFPPSVAQIAQSSFLKQGMCFMSLHIYLKGMNLTPNSAKTSPVRYTSEKNLYIIAGVIPHIVKPLILQPHKLFYFSLLQLHQANFDVNIKFQKLSHAYESHGHISQINKYFLSPPQAKC